MIKKSCVIVLSKKLRESKKTFPLKTMIKITVIEIHISENNLSLFSSFCINENIKQISLCDMFVS